MLRCLPRWGDWMMVPWPPGRSPSHRKPRRTMTQRGAMRGASWAPRQSQLLAGSKLPRSFYEGPVLEVARNAIGKILVHRSPEGVTAGRIVETEAYRGPQDRAAHSFRGRTKRTEAMFGPGGHAYMFLLYGLSWAFNIVAGKEGEPHAVLVRALEPVAGLELMSSRRGFPADSKLLTNGPGKLCQALGL